MDKKWNFLMVLALLAILVCGSARPAQAQTGILDVFPRDGTVGTELILTGSDFGWKQGEVLIGAGEMQGADLERYRNQVRGLQASTPRRISRHRFASGGQEACCANDAFLLLYETAPYYSRGFSS